MNILLDTHIVLWALADDPRLKPQHRALLENTETAIYVSAVSIWEIAIKRRLGKLEAPDGIAYILAQSDCVQMDISWAHGERAGGLPLIHSDPFDRLLIGQAQIENMPILTEDRFIRQYDVGLV